LKKAAPKTLRDIYTDENLQQANYMMAGLDPIYLMAYGDWRKMAGQPRLVKRERLGNRAVYRLSMPIKLPQMFQSLLHPGGVGANQRVPSPMDRRPRPPHLAIASSGESFGRQLAHLDAHHGAVHAPGDKPAPAADDFRLQTA
jgi:hypothetical protein